MAWVVCDIRGKAFIFNNKPHRACIYTSNDEQFKYWEGYRDGPFIDPAVSLPKGTIEKLIGRKLTWNDEPVKLE